MQPTPIVVFCCYSHQDEKLREELEKHLKSLMRNRLISTWSDRKLIPGEVWKDTIDENLKQADIIVPLVSADFMASDYCQTIEMRQAMERHRSKEAVVIPVILRPVDWRDGELGQLQALPKDGRAVTTWANQDEAFLSVTEGIRKAAERLHQRRGGALPEEFLPPPPAPAAPRYEERRQTPTGALWLLPVVGIALAGLIVAGVMLLRTPKPIVISPKQETIVAPVRPPQGNPPTDTKPNVRPRPAEPRKSTATISLPNNNVTPRQVEQTPIEVHHADPPKTSESGIQFAEAGNCAKAVPLLENEVVVNPGNVILFLDLGRCQNRLGNFSEASRSLTSAIELSPTRADLFAERARSFLGQRLDDRALGDVDQALKRDAGNRAAIELRGDVFMRRGQYEDAVGAYYEVYQRGQTRELCSKLAQAYRKNGADDLAARMEGACRQ
jgi:tetratricopeptide (TPR) repeat protein